MSLTRTMGFRALLLAVVLSLWAGRGEAAELQVLSAGAMRSIVTELAAAFEKETGNPVKLTFGTVGAIKAKPRARGPRSAAPASAWPCATARPSPTSAARRR